MRLDVLTLIFQNLPSWFWLACCIFFSRLLFVVAYHFIWEWSGLDFDVQSNLILEAGSGIIGMMSSYFIFELANYQPQISFKEYYLRLFSANVFFGIPAFYSYFFLFEYGLKSTYKFYFV